jgi:enoyl-CoA hydratase/carnithine racemase
LSFFERLEPEVHTYCRVWQPVFERAPDADIYDRGGVHTLDMFTAAEAATLETLDEIVPRAGGPVEAAPKLAREYIGRPTIAHVTNGAPRHGARR